MKNFFGTWLTTFSLPLCDLISSKKFDCICLDMEHSTISLEQMSIMIDVIHKNKKKCYVRVPIKNDEVTSKIALDCDVDGLIFPKIETINDVKKCIELTFYPPMGNRGVALYKAQRYGNKLKEYISNKSKKIDLFLMIETKSGIKNLDPIFEKYNKSISGTIIGLYDLSASFNLIGKIDSQLIKKQLNNYLNISKKYDVPTGIHHASPYEVKLQNKIKKEVLKSKNKYKYIALGTETLFLNYLIDDLFKKIK